MKFWNVILTQTLPTANYVLKENLCLLICCVSIIDNGDTEFLKPPPTNSLIHKHVLSVKQVHVLVIP